MKIDKEKGNVLFIILIAVILLGALTFTFTQSNRGSTSIITDAQADAYATRIIAYANDVKAAVKRLSLRGCAPDEISFENSFYPTSTVNPRSPATKECHIFDSNGGGLQYFELPDDMLTDPSDYPGFLSPEAQGHIAFVGTTMVLGENNDDNAEILMVVPWLRPEICTKLNEKFDSGGYAAAGIASWYLQVLGPYVPRTAPTYMDPKDEPYYCSENNITVGRSPFTFHYVLMAL